MDIYKLLLYTLFRENKEEEELDPDILELDTNYEGGSYYILLEGKRSIADIPKICECVTYKAAYRLT